MPESIRSERDALVGRDNRSENGRQGAGRRRQRPRINAWLDEEAPGGGTHGESIRQMTEDARRNLRERDPERTDRTIEGYRSALPEFESASEAESDPSQTFQDERLPAAYISKFNSASSGFHLTKDPAFLAGETPADPNETWFGSHRVSPTYARTYLEKFGELSPGDFVYQFIAKGEKSGESWNGRPRAMKQAVVGQGRVATIVEYPESESEVVFAPQLAIVQPDEPISLSLKSRERFDADVREGGYPSSLRDDPALDGSRGQQTSFAQFRPENAPVLDALFRGEGRDELSKIVNKGAFTGHSLVKAAAACRLRQRSERRAVRCARGLIRSGGLRVRGELRATYSVESKRPSVGHDLVAVFATSASSRHAVPVEVKGTMNLLQGPKVAFNYGLKQLSERQQKSAFEDADFTLIVVGSTLEERPVPYIFRQQQVVDGLFNSSPVYQE